MEALEFRPPENRAVLERMAALSVAGDGWVNLLPGVPGEEAGEPARGAFSALFGSAQAPLSMCTWVPAPTDQARSDGRETVGILHPKGRDGAAQLRDLGAGVPPGWQLLQDHVRRGLILRPPRGSDHCEVLGWMLRAGAALAVVPLTGSWQARVYLPRPERSGR